MLSYASCELAGLAAAALLETALLLALVDRRNWSRTPLPLVLLVLGAWLWHSASLGERLLDSGSLAVACRLVMAFGLLLIPSAMLHAQARLSRSGLAVGLAPNRRHARAYLPLAAFAPIAIALVRSPQASFVTALLVWIIPYSLWLAAVNGMAGAALWKAGHARDDSPGRFLRLAAVILWALAILQPFALLVARPAWPALAPWIMLAVSLSPLLLALPFAWFMSQFNVMRLVLERSLVYAVLLSAAWLVHRFLFADLRAELHDRYRLDLELIEALLLAGLLLAWPPARRRTAEALRYLLGSRVDRVREGLRQVSIELAGQVGRSPGDTLDWFATALHGALETEFVAVWLSEPPHARVSGATSLEFSSLAPALEAALQSDSLRWGTRHTAASPALFEILDDARASLAVQIARPAPGVVLAGRRSRNRFLSEEETNHIVLLVEQLSAILAAGRLLAERAEAERRALDNERLTMLGLLASSIAHEVKNPLSSIRTIAAVLAEGAEPASNSEDLRLIVSEADRLNASVQRLLSVVRPRPSTGPVQAEAVLSSTLDLVRFLARERDVSLEAQIGDALRPVAAEEAALREIFLNLLMNSIEAAGPRGQVRVDCRQQNGHVVATFRDNGPGLAPEIRGQLFRPFQTTKPTGSGLGLFITQRRVEECGGAIDCQSAPGEGACFTVMLPCHVSPALTGDSAS